MQPKPQRKKPLPKRRQKHPKKNKTIWEFAVPEPVRRTPFAFEGYAFILAFRQGLWYNNIQTVTQRISDYNLSFS
jgi:hypothetical protein